MNYLIPANTKKSKLIFGLFNTFDAILVGTGVGISLLLMLALPIEDIKWALIAIAPGVITGFLVFPIPNYHNVLTLIKSVWNFFTNRERFIWKGWCVKDGEDSDK